MRDVSHLPPAIAISAFANAAPPLVTFVPSTMMVAPCFTPASSSLISLIACRPPGVSEPRSTEASPWSVNALGAIDHVGRQIVVAKLGDPLRELPAERCHPFVSLVRGRAPMCGPGGNSDARPEAARTLDRPGGSYCSGENAAGISILFSCRAGRTPDCGGH